MLRHFMYSSLLWEHCRCGGRACDDLSDQHRFCAGGCAIDRSTVEHSPAAIGTTLDPGDRRRPFFLGTILLGQNTLILMFLVLAAYATARQGRESWAGCLIGLATAIKIYPLLFLVPFVLRLRVRVLAGFAATLFIIAGLMGSLFFGYETNLRWYQSWGRFVTRADQTRLEDPHYPSACGRTARYNNQAEHVS